MRFFMAVLLVGFVSCIASGQDQGPTQPLPDARPLAVASIHVEKKKFKSGEPIEVLIVLEAGPRGVYIPNYWGLFGGGVPGFGIELSGLSGRRGQTCGGASDAFPKSEPDARVAFKRDFIFLGAGQVVGLKTQIDCPSRRRGRYRIEGFYSPFHIDADRIAQLPETHGLVLRQLTQAEPVEIYIH